MNPRGRISQDETMADVRIEPCLKRIRAIFNGETAFDTTRALYVWERPFYPTYYIPADDIRVDVVPNGRTKDSSTRGRAELFDIRADGALKEDAGWRYPDSPIERLRDVLRFDWDAFDEWLEEDEPVYIHARDPYSRVDILHSSRHVEVVVARVKVADSHKPAILFETGLPPRFYIPLSDIRTDLLEPSPKQSGCPYKGTATYWSLTVGDERFDDFFWTYRSPLPESQKIAGLVSFYNEKVDLYVDGELQRRPRSPFS